MADNPMRRNEGTPPRHSLVDIRYRNGEIVRGIEPASRRWTINDPAFGAGYAYDIEYWQPAGERKK